MNDWNIIAKRLLKTELVKRGVTHARLAELLSEVEIAETKSSIDSKISRGTFSAVFLIQCLNVIGCNKIEIENYQRDILINDNKVKEYE